jgi:hypothetical protein
MRCSSKDGLMNTPKAWIPTWIASVTLIASMGCTQEPELVIVTETEVQVVYVEPDVCVSCIEQDAVENYIEQQAALQPDVSSPVGTDGAAQPDVGPGDATGAADTGQTGPADTFVPADPPEENPPLSIDLNLSVDSLSGFHEFEPVVTGGFAVMGVEFYLDDTRLDTDFIPPYSMTLNTAAYADGLHTITVYRPLMSAL